MATSTLTKKYKSKKSSSTPKSYSSSKSYAGSKSKSSKSYSNGYTGNFPANYTNGNSSPWSFNPWTANNSSPFPANWTPSGTTNPYLVDSVNRVFEELTRSWETSDNRPWTPRCDFWETATGYTVRCYVPGCTKSDCKIACTSTTVTISGTCSLSSCPTNCNCYCCECQTGSFSRYFTLPVPINTSSVKASCKNGVLTVTCKKSAKSKPTTVKVG